MKQTILLSAMGKKGRLCTIIFVWQLILEKIDFEYNVKLHLKSDLVLHPTHADGLVYIYICVCVCVCVCVRVCVCV